MSQNGSPNFEFNHDFKTQVCSFKDLSSDLFRENRRDLNIKSIKRYVIGKSLDSLYIKNKKYFLKTIDDNAFSHSHYSYVAIYNYDKYGFLTSYFRYPISKYLTKADSIKLNVTYYTCLNIHDTTIINEYFKDSLWEQTIHLKGKLLCFIEKEQHYVTVFDSINNRYTSHASTSTFSKTNYEYFPNGKLKSISNKNKPYSDYKLEYEYPNSKKTFITNTYYNVLEDTTYIYQNLIIKSKTNKILKSILFDKSNPTYKSTYTMHYDKMGYLTSIDRREKYKKWVDEKYTYYNFDNYYDNSTLIKTIAHYNFNVVENDMQYYFDNNNLLKSIEHQDIKEVFEYEFYKN